MNAILEALLSEVLIPEVRKLIEQHPGITDAEILVKLASDVDFVVKVGEAELALKGAA
jgi:hypothetical protein